MASSLVARIREIFGISPNLIEGHNGIYEVTINGKVVVTKQGKCSGIPSEEEILQEIRKHQSPLPGKEKLMLKAVSPKSIFSTIPLFLTIRCKSNIMLSSKPILHSEAHLLMIKRATSFRQPFECHFFKYCVGNRSFF